MTALQTILLGGLLFGVFGCGSSQPTPMRPVTMDAVQSKAQPCWVSTPQCADDGAKNALYFVGQSESVAAGWRRPSRDAFRSAQKDAEQQYARYLGVDIRSSTFLKSVLDDADYNSQFSETIDARVERTVSHLTKADEYYVADQKNASGQPVWTVFILLKIERSVVKAHQAAVAEERRLAQLQEKARLQEKQQSQKKQDVQSKALASTMNGDGWVVSVYNVDDLAAVYVNGQKVRECGFSRSCQVALAPHLTEGINRVRLVYKNHFGPWTYAYKVTQNKTVMYEGRCGQVWAYGCGVLNFRTGIVHEFKFEISRE